MRISTYFTRAGKLHTGPIAWKRSLSWYARRLGPLDTNRFD